MSVLFDILLFGCLLGMLVYLTMCVGCICLGCLLFFLGVVFKRVGCVVFMVTGYLFRILLTVTSCDCY